MKTNQARCRHSIRLQGYDYTQSGAYFITICTFDRTCIFGEIMNGEMRLNEAGYIVKTIWDELPKHYSGVINDAFVVMPNHIHGIIMLAQSNVIVGAGLKSILTDDSDKSLKPTSKIHGLTEIIRALKTFSSRRINEKRQKPGVPVWQRNYFEHVIRNDESLSRLREYIVNNPLQWEIDNENPSRKQSTESINPPF